MQSIASRPRRCAGAGSAATSGGGGVAVSWRLKAVVAAHSPLPPNARAPAAATAVAAASSTAASVAGAVAHYLTPRSCLQPVAEAGAPPRGGRGDSACPAARCRRAVKACAGAGGGKKNCLVVGLAADSGCGKSTFMRRIVNMFGGDATPPEGGNPDSNTLMGDNCTIICLDDYHSLDRTGRKKAGVTALDPKAQDFDLMVDQVKKLKAGETVMKPIYNHVSGELDAPEQITSPNVLILEGLHPFYDERVRELLDFGIYLDISDDVKFAWKIQRDMSERGHSLQSIKASIQARKPDFDAYIDTQKRFADIVIEVLPTDLIEDDDDKKILKTRMIQREARGFDTTYLYDEGSTISWIPCGRKLTCSYPGIRFFYGPDSYFDNEVSIIEMDGQFDRLEELIYVESHLSNTSTKFYGEITQQMLRNSTFPGSTNGTGLFQTICGLHIRTMYEKMLSENMENALAEPVISTQFRAGKL